MTTPATDSKLRTLEEAAETIADGSTIAIGGLSMNSVPMAFIRTLARRKVRDLTVVAIVHGMPIEWLVAAGCVRSVVSGLVSLEGFGLAPALPGRGPGARDRDRGVQRAHPDLPAPGRCLPHPVHADEGGARHRHARRSTPRRPGRRSMPRPATITSPARRSRSTSRSCMRKRRTTRGNVRVDPKLVWMDSELVKAAATTIVTVERIVPEASFRAEPHRTTYPALHRSTTVGRGALGGVSDLVLPALLLRRRLLPRLRRRAHRPRRRSGLLGRADRRARDPRRVPRRERRRRARCSRSPGGRRERRSTRSTS